MVLDAGLVSGWACFASPFTYERCCETQDPACRVTRDLQRCCASFSPSFGAAPEDVVRALSCDGLGEWGRFRVLANGFFAGDLDEEKIQEMVELAHELAYSYSGASEEFDSAYSFFYAWVHVFASYLRGKKPSFFGNILQDSYCYYGFLTAVVILHILEVELDEAGLRWLMLGEESSIDFASSSGWPIRFDHIALNTFTVPKVEIAPKPAVNPDRFPIRPASEPEIVVQHFGSGHVSLDHELPVTLTALFPAVRALVTRGFLETSCSFFELCSLERVEEVEQDTGDPRADLVTVSWLSDVRRVRALWAAQRVGEAPPFVLYLGHPLTQDRSVHLERLNAKVIVS